MEDGSTVDCCATYEYLGTIVCSNEGNEVDINKKIGKGRQLYSFIWN